MEDHIKAALLWFASIAEANGIFDETSYRLPPPPPSPPTSAYNVTDRVNMDNDAATVSPAQPLVIPGLSNNDDVSEYVLTMLSLTFSPRQEFAYPDSGQDRNGFIIVNTLAQAQAGAARLIINGRCTLCGNAHQPFKHVASRYVVKTTGQQNRRVFVYFEANKSVWSVDSALMHVIDWFTVTLSDFFDPNPKPDHVTCRKCPTFVNQTQYMKKRPFNDAIENIRTVRFSTARDDLELRNAIKTEHMFHHMFHVHQGDICYYLLNRISPVAFPSTFRTLFHNDWARFQFAWKMLTGNFITNDLYKSVLDSQRAEYGAHNDVYTTFEGRLSSRFKKLHNLWEKDRKLRHVSMSATVILTLQRVRRDWTSSPRDSRTTQRYRKNMGSSSSSQASATVTASTSSSMAAPTRKRQSSSTLTDEGTTAVKQRATGAFDMFNVGASNDDDFRDSIVDILGDRDVILVDDDASLVDILGSDTSPDRDELLATIANLNTLLADTTMAAVPPPSILDQNPIQAVERTVWTNSQAAFVYQTNADTVDNTTSLVTLEQFQTNVLVDRHPRLNTEFDVQTYVAAVATKKALMQNTLFGSCVQTSTYKLLTGDVATLFIDKSVTPKHNIKTVFQTMITGNMTSFPWTSPNVIDDSDKLNRAQVSSMLNVLSTMVTKFYKTIILMDRLGKYPKWSLDDIVIDQNNVVTFNLPPVADIEYVTKADITAHMLMTITWLMTLMRAKITEVEKTILVNVTAVIALIMRIGENNMPDMTVPSVIVHELPPHITLGIMEDNFLQMPILTFVNSLSEQGDDDAAAAAQLSVVLKKLTASQPVPTTTVLNDDISVNTSDVLQYIQTT